MGVSGSLFAHCRVGLEGVSQGERCQRPRPCRLRRPLRKRGTHQEVGMKKLLLQLDPDRHPSAFDRIVAYDAGADEVLSYSGVTATDVTVAGAWRDLHAWARRPPEHRRVGGRHRRRLGRGAVRGGAEGLLRAVSSERDDGRQRLQHDRRRGGGAPGRRRHPVRRPGGDPGRNRAGRNPGGRAPRSRRGGRRAVLAIAGPGAERVRAAEGDLRRRRHPLPSVGRGRGDAGSRGRRGLPDGRGCRCHVRAPGRVGQASPA